MLEQEKVLFFRDWLREDRWTVARLAGVLGTSRSGIYLWISGKCAPTVEVLAKLESLSSGRLTARSFARQPLLQERFSIKKGAK